MQVVAFFFYLACIVYAIFMQYAMWHFIIKFW